MATRKPKTGERRKTRQPLKIDRLIEYLPAIRDKIQELKNRDGLTWQEIEDLSALSPDRGGFVSWENLPIHILELFPDMRLPHSNLHRWYDLRIQQVVAETMHRSALAREVAAAFAKANVEGTDDAVLNAARDQIMSVLAEDATPGGRMRAAKALIGLAEMLQQRRTNDLKERQVAVNEKKVKALLEREKRVRQKLEAETAKLQKKAAKGKVTADDLKLLTRRTFGFEPKEPEEPRG
jgi:hypothetical protein